MKRSYLVQHDGTDPTKWEAVEGETLRHAGAKVAARHGPGLVTVYVSDAKSPRHKNGAPMYIHELKMNVERRRAALAKAEGRQA